jgi:hypothetical protein
MFHSTPAINEFARYYREEGYYRDYGSCLTGKSGCSICARSSSCRKPSADTGENSIRPNGVRKTHVPVFATESLLPKLDVNNTDPMLTDWWTSAFVPTSVASASEVYHLCAEEGSKALAS